MKVINVDVKIGSCDTCGAVGGAFFEDEDGNEMEVCPECFLEYENTLLENS